MAAAVISFSPHLEQTSPTSPCSPASSSACKLPRSRPTLAIGGRRRRSRSADQSPTTAGGSSCTSSPAIYSSRATLADNAPTIGSLRATRVDRSPAATPSVLWPPTPSPSTAVGDAGFAHCPLLFGAFGTTSAGAPQAAPFGADVAHFAPMPAVSALGALQYDLFQAAASTMFLQMVPELLAAAPPAPVVQAQGALAASAAQASLEAFAPTPPPPLRVQSRPGVPLQLSSMLTPAPAEAQPSEPDAILGTLTGPRPSLGSSSHGAVECRPCAWYYKPKGCQLGSQCDFCHLCPDGELKNRRKAKVAAIRQRPGR